MRSVKVVLSYSAGQPKKGARPATGSHQKKLILVPGKPIIFGRDPSCQVQLADAWVSSRHLRFSIDEDMRAVRARVMGRNGAWRIREGDEQFVEREDVICANGHSWYLRGYEGNTRIHVSVFNMQGVHDAAEHLVEDIVICQEKIQELDRENTILYSKLAATSPLDSGWEHSALQLAGTEDEETLKFHQRIAHLEKELVARRAQVEADMMNFEKTQSKEINDVMESNKMMRAKSDEMQFKRRKLDEDLDSRKKILDPDHPMQDRDRHLAYEEMLKIEEELELKALTVDNTSLALEAGVAEDDVPSDVLALIE